MMFVAGGVYLKGDKLEFELARPTGGKPYVFSNASRFELMKHHAHMYEISKIDGESVFVELARLGDCCLGAPKGFMLTKELSRSILDVIKSNEVMV